MSATTGTQAELLYVMPAAITKNTYTTIAAFSGVAGTNTICSIPAGFFFNESPNPVGRTLLLEAFGTTATTSAATLAVALNINPTVATSTGNVSVAGALAPTAAITVPFHLRAYIQCSVFATSTMTLQINGTWRVESIATGGVPTTSSQCSGFSGSIASLDPRVTQYVELFGTWSASAAGNTTTLQQMVLWGLN
jgi:hypothetical protein